MRISRLRILRWNWRYFSKTIGWKCLVNFNKYRMWGDSAENTLDCREEQQGMGFGIGIRKVCNAFVQYHRY
jgi:hypothetical protein